MSRLKLIVGLGNPGEQYVNTRHNVGFWWAQAVQGSRHISLKLEPKFHGLVNKFAGPNGEVWLLLPNTYMNESGRSVAALAKFYKIAPEEVLVVHDDLDLPPGSVKLKQGGGHAGHNGLRDIMAQLGSPDFWRLRLGIGHPGVKNAVVNYVLHPPRQEERRAIEAAIDKSLEVLPELLENRFAVATQRLHTATE